MRRDRLPPRSKVDGWVSELVADTDWLWDSAAQKCGQYRWACSGIGASSHSENRVNGGDISDPTSRNALTFTATDVRRAGWLLCDASGLVRRARGLLTPQGPENVSEGLVRAGHVSRVELADLRARQARRQARGEGYGDA